MRRWSIVVVVLTLLVSSAVPVFAGRMYDPELNRFATPDPALNTQNPGKLLEKSLRLDQGRLFSTSPYSYGFNNPLKFVDPDGRWSTSIHNRILKEAFQGILTNRQIKVLQGASAWVDQYKNQNSENSFKHAMRGEDQSVQEAEKLMNKFIEEKVGEFIKKEGNAALEALGEALHPIMDSTSPVHEGFQEWEGLDNPVEIIKGIEHSFQERKISPEKQKETVEKVRQFYLDAVKKKKQAKENQEKQEEEN